MQLLLPNCRTCRTEQTRKYKSSCREVAGGDGAGGGFSPGRPRVLSAAVSRRGSREIVSPIPVPASSRRGRRLQPSPQAGRVPDAAAEPQAPRLPAAAAAAAEPESRWRGGARHSGRRIRARKPLERRRAALRPPAPSPQAAGGGGAWHSGRRRRAGLGGRHRAGLGGRRTTGSAGGWRRGLQEARGRERPRWIFRVGPQNLFFVGFERWPVEGLLRGVEVGSVGRALKPRIHITRAVRSG